jgi:anti-anti-sigma factor
MDLLTIREIHDLGAFALEGELDMASAEVLLSRVDGARGAGELVLDMTGVTFMDSSGLRAILQLAQSRNGNGPVVLRRPSQPVARLLEIAIPGEVPGLRVERSAIDAG